MGTLGAAGAPGLQTELLSPNSCFALSGPSPARASSPHTAIAVGEKAHEDGNASSLGRPLRQPQAERNCRTFEKWLLRPRTQTPDYIPF